MNFVPFQLPDFLLFLFFAVLVAVVLFAFTMGILVKASLRDVLRNPKAKRARRVKVKKKKPPQKEKLKPQPPQDPRCRIPDGYVGMLRKMKKDQPYPEACSKPALCPYFVECIGYKKKGK